MEPNNTQADPMPVQVPVQPVMPPIQESAPKKSSKNFMMVGIIVVVILAIILTAGIYIYMSMPSKTAMTYETNSTVNTTPAPVKSTASAVVVEDESDLDNLLVELASADEGLTDDLTALEKDSDF